MLTNKMITDPKLRHMLAKVLNDTRHWGHSGNWEAGYRSGYRSAVERVQHMNDIERLQRERAADLERERRKAQRRLAEINRGIRHMERLEAGQ